MRRKEEISYAVVTIDEAILFIADGQMTDQYLGDQVRIGAQSFYFTCRTLSMLGILQRCKIHSFVSFEFKF